MHSVVKKFLLIILGYAVFAIGAETGSRVKEMLIVKKQQAGLEAIVDWQNKAIEQEKKDFYGGKTPDETLAMFIDVLKKGDYDLAEKYIASRDAKAKFEKMKEEGKMAVFVESLSRIKPYSTEPSYFMVLDKNGKEARTIILDQNLNGTWKITDL